LYDFKGVPMRLAREGNQERGQIFVELALIVPFLIMAIGGVFEFGRMLTHYHLLDRITYEGLRLGINIHDLEQDSEVVNEYYTPEDETTRPGHRLLQLRIAELLSLNGFDISEFQVTSRFSLEEVAMPTTPVVAPPGIQTPSPSQLGRGLDQRMTRDPRTSPGDGELELPKDFPGGGPTDDPDKTDDTSPPPFIGGRVEVQVNVTYRPMIFSSFFSVPLGIEKTGFSVTNRFSSQKPRVRQEIPKVPSGGGGGGGGGGLKYDEPGDSSVVKLDEFLDAEGRF